MRRWLNRHGFPLPVGKLSLQQAHEIRDCFDLLDEDSSGALSVMEFRRAFRLLGLKVRTRLQGLFAGSVIALTTGADSAQLANLLQHRWLAEGAVHVQKEAAFFDVQTSN